MLECGRESVICLLRYSITDFLFSWLWYFQSNTPPILTGFQRILKLIQVSIQYHFFTISNSKSNTSRSSSSSSFLITSTALLFFQSCNMLTLLPKLNVLLAITSLISANISSYLVLSFVKSSERKLSLSFSDMEVVPHRFRFSHK